MKHLEVKIMNFAKAITRLDEAIAHPDDGDFKVDVCVKRFEFTYEMCWKTIQSVLREDGIVATNAREVFEKAAIKGIIDHEAIWLQMKDDRNDTSHEYDEKKAAEIAKNIPVYAKEFKFVLEKIKQNSGL